MLRTYLIPRDKYRCKIQHTQSVKLVDNDVSLRPKTFCKQVAHVAQAFVKKSKLEKTD